MSFADAPDPLEVAAVKPHRCDVRAKDPHYHTDRLWREAGTCWRCPDCWRWWIARRWLPIGYTSDSVCWRRVIPFSPAWFRCRKAEKALR